jgi:hypothetical protein
MHASGDFEQTAAQASDEQIYNLDVALAGRRRSIAEFLAAEGSESSCVAGDVDGLRPQPAGEDASR